MFMSTHPGTVMATGTVTQLGMVTSTAGRPGGWLWSGGRSGMC
jgi:2-keto-4-pentenoate hydratase/2-oxohepta-3-ene-1,7-dioic acid hydratase in catechol pathway